MQGNGAGLSMSRYMRMRTEPFETGPNKVAPYRLSPALAMRVSPTVTYRRSGLMQGNTARSNKYMCMHASLYCLLQVETFQPILMAVSMSFTGVFRQLNIAKGFPQS